MIFKWFRNRRKQRMFKKAFIMVAREKWEAGDMETPEYARIVTAANDPVRIKKVIASLEAEDNMLGGIRDWNWDAILDWVRENLIPALKIILPLLLLLDEQE